MQKLIKNIFIVSLASVIIIGTGGLNIFIHHCNCTNSEAITFLVETHSDCCQDEQISQCCKVIENTDKLPHGGSCSEDHSDCCYTVQKYLRIDDDYLLSLNEISFKHFASAEILVPENLLCDPLNNFENIFQYLIELPPLLAGKTLVLYLHKYKFDPPHIS